MGGGKTQLLDEFYKRLPEGLGEKGKITRMSSRSSEVEWFSSVLHENFHSKSVASLMRMTGLSSRIG